MASKIPRIYTGLAGLPVCKEPQKELLKHFSRVMRAAEKLPEESNYRKITLKLMKERKEIVESTSDPLEIEKKIGAGLCEEMIEDAKNEVRLIETMKEYKPWEPLVEKPQPNQWKWPV